METDTLTNAKRVVGHATLNATTERNDMAFVTVEGTITRTNTKGFKLEETIRLNDGRTFAKYWTIWGKHEDALEGDIVVVKGELSAKIFKDYQTGQDKLTRNGERIVELIINATDKQTLQKGTGSVTSDKDAFMHAATVAPNENAPF
jgi:hypothetical protein